MKKQYGIFQIDTKTKYLNDGANQLIFLSDRYLHDTEEEAINWFPSEDGHYVIMPVYVTTEQKEFNDKWDNKIKFAEELRDAFKRMPV
jgi:hypothetical protein